MFNLFTATVALVALLPCVLAQRPGSVDTSFNPGSSTDYSRGPVAVQPDGKVIVTYALADDDRFHSPRLVLRRLNSDGQVDPAYQFNAKPFSEIRSVAHESDGGILVAGWDIELSIQGTGDVLVRLRPDGTTDPDFRPGLIDGPLSSLIRQPDGMIVIGGAFASVGGFRVDGVARLFGGPGVEFQPSHPRRLADGSLEVQVSAEPGRQITLEATASLVSPVWQIISSRPAENGTATFTDPDAAKFPQRFYRAVLR